MNQNRLIQIAIVSLSLIVIGSLSLFIVKEGEEALVIRFGEIIGEQANEQNEYKPGIHFKIPFIDKVKHISIKLQTIESPRTRVLTAEQKLVDVDYYIKWKVDDLENFYKSVSNNSMFASSSTLMSTARGIIQDKVSHEIRTEFGKRNLSNLISGDRGNVIDLLRSKAEDAVKLIGVTIIDVRIKRIDYPREVTLTVYDRMSSKRKQFATLYRANGEAEAEKLKSDADRRALVIVAEANKEGAEIRAKGEAKAAEIYNESYSKDSSFYKLYRSVKSYQETFSEKDTMIMDSENMKYLQKLFTPKK